MSSRDKSALAVLVLCMVSFGEALVAAWPILAAHLNVYMCVSLILAHLAILLSLYDLYRKASRQIPVQRANVLMTAGLVFITSAIYLGTVVHIRPQ